MSLGISIQQVKKVLRHLFELKFLTEIHNNFTYFFLRLLDHTTFSLTQTDSAVQVDLSFKII